MMSGKINFGPEAKSANKFKKRAVSEINFQRYVFIK